MPIPSFKEPYLEQLCRVLGDTNDGLTGTEIALFLHEIGACDPGAGMTKWKRLHSAFEQKQREDQCANNIIHFHITRQKMTLPLRLT